MVVLLDHGYSDAGIGLGTGCQEGGNPVKALVGREDAFFLKAAPDRLGRGEAIVDVDLIGNRGRLGSASYGIRGCGGVRHRVGPDRGR